MCMPFDCACSINMYCVTPYNKAQNATTRQVFCTLVPSFYRRSENFRFSLLVRTTKSQHELFIKFVYIQTILWWGSSATKLKYRAIFQNEICTIYSLSTVLCATKACTSLGSIQTLGVVACSYMIKHTTENSVWTSLVFLVFTQVVSWAYHVSSAPSPTFIYVHVTSCVLYLLTTEQNTNPQGPANCQTTHHHQF